jgi:hypothetical protein
VASVSGRVRLRVISIASTIPATTATPPSTISSRRLRAVDVLAASLLCVEHLLMLDVALDGVLPALLGGARCSACRRGACVSPALPSSVTCAAIFSALSNAEAMSRRKPSPVASPGLSARLLQAAT